MKRGSWTSRRRSGLGAGAAFIGAALIAGSLSAVRAQQTSRSVWDGVYTQQQADRGKPLYAEKCAMCHEGGESAPLLTGTAFAAEWNGLSVGDVFERIRLTMPQNDPGQLTRQQNVDILAYILRGNDFPAGATELATDTAVLKQIRYEPKQ